MIERLSPHKIKSENLKTTLRLISDVAPYFRDKWTLIGSAAAFVAGADIGEVGDVDLLLSEHDFEKLELLWGDREKLPARKNSQFRSKRFSRFSSPLPIEVMAGFELKAANGEWIKVTPKTRVRFGELFAPSVNEQISLLRLMRRKKDESRIAALLATLTPRGSTRQSVT